MTHLFYKPLPETTPSATNIATGATVTITETCPSIRKNIVPVAGTVVLLHKGQRVLAQEKDFTVIEKKHYRYSESKLSWENVRAGKHSLHRVTVLAQSQDEHEQYVKEQAHKNPNVKLSWTTLP